MKAKLSMSFAVAACAAGLTLSLASIAQAYFTKEIKPGPPEGSCCVSVDGIEGASVKTTNGWACRHGALSFNPHGGPISPAKQAAWWKKHNLADWRKPQKADVLYKAPGKGKG
jgi:hypothetical protein